MNEAFPKISVISPSFNQGRYVEEAIVSILEQDYPFFEHIIIDGGSTDNTIEILKKYPHLKWISEKDEGQSDALNKGFKMATGEIIGWLNTDDFYLPGAFHSVAKFFKENKVDAVYGNFRFINGEGQVTREIVTQNSSKWMSVFYCFIPSTTFFFQRKILDHQIFIDKSFEIAMDKEFFAHLYFSGFSIKKINSFLSHFRWHMNNKSLDTGPTKHIRKLEEVRIFQRYSTIKIPGIFQPDAVKLMILFCQIFRLISRTLKIGIYREM